MLISQVIQRLQELQRIESDIEVTVQNSDGEPVSDYWFDVYQDKSGLRCIMLSRSVEPVKQEVHIRRHSNR